MEQSRIAGKTAASPRLPGSLRQRAIAKAIWLYLNREFSDAREQREIRFPQKGSTHQLRVTPWIRRVATDLGTPYRKDPRRTSDDVEPELWQDYLSVLEVAGANAALKVISQHVVVLNQGYGLVVPDGESGVRVIPIPVHQLYPTITDPFRSGDVDSLERIEIAIEEADEGGFAIESLVRITAESAEWLTGPREGKGFYREDKGNPFGAIPLLAARGQTVIPGQFLVHVPEDLLHAQRAMDQAWTSLLHTAEIQGYSQPVFKVEDATANAAEQEVGPETAVRVRPGEDFDFASPTPDLEGYLAQVRSYIEVETAMVGLSPATFLKTSATTGVARAVEMWDRQQERLDPEAALTALEQRLYFLVAKLKNSVHGREVWPEKAKVRVAYVHEGPPSDPLHEVQAFEREMALGQTPPWEPLMRKYGLTEEQAKLKLDENLTAYRRVMALKGTAGPKTAVAP